MKLIIGSILAIVILGIGVTDAYALDLGAKLTPSKIVENSEGMIQIFALQNDKMFPSIIDDLTVVSSDSSIIQILEIEQTDQSFIKNVKIKAKTTGETTIGIVATGFSSIELPVTVHEALQKQNQFLVEVIPDTFTFNGPNEGYYSIQLVDSDNSPVRAENDLLIDVTSSGRNIVSLIDSQPVIEKGEYYTIGKFQVRNEGQANLFFSGDGLDEISSKIEVVEEKDLDVQLYTFPKKVNSHQSSKGYIIAQLQDEDGKPVIAEHNIPVHYKVTGSNYTDSVNTSDLFKDLEGEGVFNIRQGTYWGFTTYNALSGVEDTYDISISTENPLSYEEDSVEITAVELYDDKLIKFEAFPMLTTGNAELIGIVYLESPDGDPIIADKDIVVRVDSSDAGFAAPRQTMIYEGDGAALVYADMGNGSLDDLELHVVADKSEIVVPDVYSFGTNSTNLVAKPLVSKVAPGTTFPLIVHLTDADDELTTFPITHDVFVESSNVVRASPKIVKTGDSLSLVDLSALKTGSKFIHVQYDTFVTNSTIDVIAPNQHNLLLDGPQSIFAGVENMFTVQIVDDEDKPIFADRDVDVKLIIKDPNILNVPNSVTIEKGTYYKSFTVEPNQIGSTEVTVTANDMPLSRFGITTDNLTPEIEINVPENIESGSTFMTKILVSYNGMPLENVNIDWNVDNAIVQGSDVKTSKNGEANIALLANDAGSVKISATVSDDFFFKETVKKSLSVSGIELPFEPVEIEPEFEEFTVGGIDPLLVTVPVSIVAVGFLLQRKGKLTVTKKSVNSEDSF